VGSRNYALFILALVSAVLLMLTVSTGATFTAPTANPSNQVGTATLAAPTGVTAAIQSNGGTVRLAWTATSSIWASGHRVYRTTSAGGPYSLLQQIAGRATVTYDDVPGVGAFFYVIRGYYNTNGANWESVDSAQVWAKPLDHFTFNAIATQHSGTAFSVTITAEAQDSSTVTGFNGVVNLSSAFGSIVPATGTFTNGSLTQSVTITGPYATNETISASGGAPLRTGASGSFTLNRFRATAITLANSSGGTVGRVENWDSIALTFSEAANPTSFGTCSGMTFSGADLVFNDANPDTITANGSVLKIGTIALGANGYMVANNTANNSGCVWSAGNTVLTLYIQGLSTANTGTVSGASTAIYTPNATIMSAAGEAIDTAQAPSVTGVLF
jgi:hypothetical protein